MLRSHYQQPVTQKHQDLHQLSAVQLTAIQHEAYQRRQQIDLLKVCFVVPFKPLCFIYSISKFSTSVHDSRFQIRQWYITTNPQIQIQWMTTKHQIQDSCMAIELQSHVQVWSRDIQIRVLESDSTHTSSGVQCTFAFHFIIYFFCDFTVK